MNKDGRLFDRTAQAGLSELKGFWNGIAARDLDNDGDMDYVVTNLGLNTKYKASPQEPLGAFFLQARGELVCIEASSEQGTWYPIRGRTSFLNLWPALQEKFPTYRSFASASLDDIAPATSLKSAQRLEVNTLETGLLLNNGAGRFTFVALWSRSVGLMAKRAAQSLTSQCAKSGWSSRADLLSPVLLRIRLHAVASSAR